MSDEKTPSPAKLGLLLTQIPEDGLSVRQDDFDSWMDNPMTAVFMYRLTQYMHEAFLEHLNANNMNAVCEWRGFYKAIAHVFKIPASIPRSGDGSTKEEAREMKRKIEEMINVE